MAQGHVMPSCSRETSVERVTACGSQPRLCGPGYWRSVISVRMNCARTAWRVRALLWILLASSSSVCPLFSGTRWMWLVTGILTARFRI